MWNRRRWMKEQREEIDAGADVRRWMNAQREEMDEEAEGGDV